MQKQTKTQKIAFLTQNFKGIGKIKAEKILEEFPDMDDFFLLLDLPDAYERLGKFLSATVLCSFMKQLKVLKEQDTEIQFLIKCGIPYWTATKLASSEDSLKSFYSHPYKIGYEYEINFEAIDKCIHIYQRKQTSPDLSQERMKHLLLSLLLRAESSGHTYLTLDQLAKKVNRYQFGHQYAPNCYTAASLILYVLDEELFFIQGSKKYQNWKIYKAETYRLEMEIAENVRRLCSSDKKHKREVVLPDFHFQYDEIQKAIIASAAEPGLKIITGPPGSGKTAVVNGILQYFSKLHPKAICTLCAPTGRAAKHLAEITDRPAATIHRTLGINQFRPIDDNQPLQSDLVICDESSMLNLEISYALLSRIKTGAVVYLVGDKDQLPAVGAGNVLHDLIRSGSVPVYHLTKVYRQDGIILENARRINQGLSQMTVDPTFQIQSFSEEKAMKGQVLDYFRSLYDPADPFETQILVPSYKSDCGIVAINQAIQAMNRNKVCYKSKIGNVVYKYHDKVLMTKNDPQGSYQNGSMGLFISASQNDILVDFEGTQVTLPKAALKDMTLGYAVSVHKAQGSEYKHVILCLPEKPSCLLKRNIVYTGVTRAKKDIHVLYMNTAFSEAVAHNEEPFVQTGLAQKLGGKGKQAQISEYTHAAG